MDKRFIKIQHKGVQVYCYDYSGLSNLKEDEFINVINEAKKKTLEWGKNQRSLVDMQKTNVNSNIMKVFRETSKVTAPLIKKSAILGIGGVKSVLLNGFNLFSKMDLKAFTTKEKALDWLVEG